jgi:Bacteriophytochrome (light-regulated signal transduction histidine kinase)
MNFGRKELLERRLTTLSKVAALISAAVGLAVLFGWIFDVHALITISPISATMKANVAVAFILSGITLWSLVGANRDNISSPSQVKRAKLLTRVSRVCAMPVALIGLLTLSQHIFGWDLGIDNLIVQDHHTAHTLYPGRMSPVTASDFLLLSAAFLLVDFETRSGKRPAQWLVLPVFVDGFIALLGYAYGARWLYRVGANFAMSLHSAVLFVLISAGFLFARPSKGLMVVATDTTPGGWIFRRFLPTAILMIPALGWLRLHGQHAGLYGFEFGLALMVMSNVAILSVLIWWAASFIRNEFLDRTKSEQRLGKDKERAAEQAAILERRVAERTAELQEIVAELERSSYTISHDLRAPIRAMQSFADLLLVDFGEKLGPSGRDYVDRIKTSAQRMDRLIEGVLAYSRVSRSPVPLAAVNLDKLVDALVPDFAAPAAVQVSHPLGTVRANQGLLEQAILNLLENAAKFVRPGTRPQIDVWTESDHGKLRLVVHDHGIGVPTETGDRIFGTFERAHEGYPGTGIGLAIVKRAIERMQGRVGFESKPDEGSSFWLELPSADIEAAA